MGVERAQQHGFTVVVSYTFSVRGPQIKVMTNTQWARILAGAGSASIVTLYNNMGHGKRNRVQLILKQKLCSSKTPFYDSVWVNLRGDHNNIRGSPGFFLGGWAGGTRVLL